MSGTELFERCERSERRIVAVTFRRRRQVGLMRSWMQDSSSSRMITLDVDCFGMFRKRELPRWEGAAAGNLQASAQRSAAEPHLDAVGAVFADERRAEAAHDRQVQA